MRHIKNWSLLAATLVFWLTLESSSKAVEWKIVNVTDAEGRVLNVLVPDPESLINAVRIGPHAVGELSTFNLTGHESDGRKGTLRITSGPQTMIMDGNEIDALQDGLHLNINTSEAVSIAVGGVMSV